MSESVCSLNDTGDRKLCSESSKETFADDVPRRVFIGCGCSWSDESKSVELRSAPDSFQHQGDVPRHSEAVWYDDDREGVYSEAVTNDSSSVEDFKLEFQS